jgi:predicted transport protein
MHVGEARRISVMPVFRGADEAPATKLAPESFPNEKALQRWFEANLEIVLGVRFVATEFSTGQKHGGRIDTLGLDEEGAPVIVEYKWDKSESVINQGLFYLDWLIDHKGDFTVAAQAALGHEVEIHWTSPRLVIVAAGYSKYDSYAVNQLPRSIELLRYQRYADNIIVVEPVVDALTAKPSKKISPPTLEPPSKGNGPTYDVDFHTAKTTVPAREAFLDLRDRILALDGVEERANQKSQISYRATRSFCAFAFQKNLVKCQFKGPSQLPAGVDPEGRAKDITAYEWGYPWVCDLRDADDVDGVFALVKQAYDFEQ